MSLDTTYIKVVTDSTVKSKSFVEKTITIEKSDYNKVDYLSKVFDLFGIISWPLAIIIIVLLLKRQIIQLLEIISLKIRDSKSFSISKEGISVASGVTGEIPLDSKTKDSTNNIFPDFPLADNSSKKILSTLWIHQIEYDPDFKTRWTFTLGANSPDFTSFLQAIQRLQWLGIITIERRNGQFFLTDLGIKYCETNKDKLGDFSYFKQ
ncbi:MAG: hypothetical protein IH597_00250 [Bacteroidales bacterium]|nr:hypothetical protein [Bacteroidales bacterium]